MTNTENRSDEWITIRTITDRAEALGYADVTAWLSNLADTANEARQHANEGKDYEIGYILSGILIALQHEAKPW